MVSVDVELALVGLVAMMEPATLLSSTLILVIGERPLRTGTWFFLGGVGATIAVGVLAAFLLGGEAAPSQSGPRTWVLVFDLVAGTLLLAYAARTLSRPADPEQTARNVARMNAVAAAPALKIVAAGALLANAGPFMLIALKNVSELNPTAGQYIVDWVIFALASLLPLGLALILLRVAPGWTAPRLAGVRRWVEQHARTIAIVIVVALAISLLREGIAGFTQ
jgi:hypothetical protein